MKTSDFIDNEVCFHHHIDDVGDMSAVTYKSFSERDTFITAKVKCLWYQENASLEIMKQKQIILCDSYFQNCGEEYKFESYMETICNKHIIFSANNKITNPVINK